VWVRGGGGGVDGDELTARPYYQDDLVTLYRGDAHQFAGLRADSIITDPIWPNATVFKHKDPYGLLCSVLEGLYANRVVIHLGCDSDPRFLCAVPKRWQFIRVCNLRYAVPSYKGRLLYTGDIAYVFGKPAKSVVGARVYPGDNCSVKSDKLFHTSNGRNKSFSRKPGVHLRHPSPRRLEHLVWLVKWFGGSSVLDPFAGSGTTLLACKRMGVPAVGVEINRSYAKLAAERLEREPL
jgi:DNA methylase